MKQIHSLPDPREYGFRWKDFEKAQKKLEHVEGKRKEVRRREAELKARIKSEEQDDVRRLAESILSGKDDAPGPATPELKRLAAEMKELHRLSEALAKAEPQAEAGLIRTVQENRETWIPQVDDALMKAFGEERAALQKALELAEAPHAKRQRLQTFATWVRTTPPSFSPPADVSVRSAFDRLGNDVDQAERLLHERLANENLAGEETA
jgi:hypothetical protein